ncbi:uncharacterized protein LOC130139419 [Syzygium oleosum]|uniref:uncharacterized protein LOC130139419 n=1 Tax=Syzygium oleosum TaxID=219896 RepID=UPI0024BBD16D|nr:uncharacterized protein LOC130139419 [Syzygium oleosum]
MVQSHSQAPNLRSRNPDHPRNHLFLQLLCEARQELRIYKQFEVFPFNLSTQARCDISSLKLKPQKGKEFEFVNWSQYACRQGCITSELLWWSCFSGVALVCLNFSRFGLVCFGVDLIHFCLIEGMRWGH